MKPEIVSLAKSRLAKAREAFRDGVLLLKGGSLTGAVNRLYYAAFYGARALLATREVDSSRHSGIIRLFQRHFVNSGMVDEDVARGLPRAFERRLDSDYEDFAPITREEVESLRNAVLLFIDECERVLNNMLEASRKGF